MKGTRGPGFCNTIHCPICKQAMSPANLGKHLPVCKTHSTGPFAHLSVKQFKQFRIKLRKYGITPDDYLKLLEKQGHACAICGGVEKDSRLYVDHCHSTEKIRGLLCSPCNLAIGLFRDNTITMANALDYLEASVPYQRDGHDGATHKE